MKIASRAVSIRRNGLARWFGLLSKIGLAKLLVLVAVAANPGMVGLSFMGFLALALASLVTRVAWTDVPGDVEVDAQSVTLRRGQGERRIARADVLGAVAVQHVIAGAVPVHAVEITLRARGLGGEGDVMRVRTNDRAEADALVRELGFGAGGRRVRIDFASMGRPMLDLFLLLPAFVIANLVTIVVAGISTALVGPIPSQPAGALFFASFFLGFELVKRAARAPRWVVGDDGLVIEKAFDRLFVPRERIQSIAEHGLARPAEIVRSDGTTLAAPRGAGIDRERVLGAIEALRDRLAPRDPKPNAPDLVRGDRSVKDLREDLRQRIEQPTYREAATTTETAEALMKSPDASLDERVAAALALRIAGEPPQKLRIAADAFVDDATREALEAVAADDDVAIERALLSSRRKPR